MDVFRTGRRGRVVPLTEENYRRETNRKAPFVQMRGGHPSYFAVCPACGNPILICNLFKRTEGSRSANPYGRHYSASVPTDKAGRELYALMRDQFDRYVYIWEKTTGLHVGRGYARELLSMWRADEGWRYYRASYFNHSFMLLYAAPAHNIMGR